MVMMKSWNKNQPKLEFNALEIDTENLLGLYNANDSHNKSKTIKIGLGSAKLQNTEDQMFYR